MPEVTNKDGTGSFSELFTKKQLQVQTPRLRVSCIREVPDLLVEIRKAQTCSTDNGRLSLSTKRSNICSVLSIHNQSAIASVGTWQLAGTLGLEDGNWRILLKYSLDTIGIMHVW